MPDIEPDARAARRRRCCGRGGLDRRVRADPRPRPRGGGGLEARGGRRGGRGAADQPAAARGAPGHRARRDRRRDHARDERGVLGRLARARQPHEARARDRVRRDQRGRRDPRPARQAARARRRLRGIARARQRAGVFGAFTGSGILRRDPPDRYVLNYRASYEEETARMVNYLLDVKKVPDRVIVVFAQNDSYGDAGFEGATNMLRRHGRDDAVLRVGYDRNTLNVDDAVNKIAEYHSATVRVGNELYHPRHPVRAIIMVATYKAAARFIQKIRDRKIEAMLLNVSFVGSNALSEELLELGRSYAQGVIVTQVVPHYESGATGVLRYRDALKKFHPDQHPDFVSLEGYIVGQLFAEGVRRAGRDIDTEKLIDAFEAIRDFDPGIGGNLSFGMSQHQASHKVWGTQLDEHGAFRSIDME
ncbi:MAG: ABC transporter substrate-binding protein [Deltaproteobacteria bacterium]|nr:MAG: ABC transporter substrate-binding protein [Deltaproteobacteria bacterium]